LTHLRSAPSGRRFVDLGDLRLRLFEHDSRPSLADGRAPGTTLVLLHGAGGNYLQWPPAMRRMSGLRVLAPDLPGHGDSFGQACADTASYARVVSRLLDVLEVTKCVVAGYSMGGGISLDLAHDDPKRVIGLAILGAGERIPISIEVVKLLGRVVGGDGDSYREGSPHLRPLTRAAFERIDREVLAQDLAACAAFDARPYAADIRPPTLIVAGEQDGMVPVSECRALHRRIANSELHVLPGVGHTFLWERTPVVTDLMQRLTGRARSFAVNHAQLTRDKVLSTDG
jgi:pimeloyl-ACP methyl ester carboxylesterase